jgi:hypothetical protein
VPFQVRDVLAEPAAFEELLALGFCTTPVTVVAGHSVAGTDLRPLEPWLQERRALPADAGSEPLEARERKERN